MSRRLPSYGRLFLLLLLIPFVWRPATATNQQTASTRKPGHKHQVTVPSRPMTPLHMGDLGKQGSEVEFTPSSRTVTLKLMVEDPNGYFVPNIRRENFAVYEDGALQKNVTAETEHAPVTVALLMEFGGRYHELNKVLGTEVPEIGRRLLEVLGRDDKVAVFKYDSKLDTLADFRDGHDRLDAAFDRLTTPGFSEANLYDALSEALKQTQTLTGRKALVVVSSGIDTFSKDNYEDVLQLAQNAGTPIYTIGLGELLRREASVYGAKAPFAHIDWSAAEKRLEALAKVSGGRAYSPDSTLGIPAVYDDIMENLRLRYVITYVSSNPATSGPPRKIRVALVNPKTGAPLVIRDATGKLISARLFVQEYYSPTASSGD